MTLYIVQARGNDDAALVRAHFIKDGFAWGGFLLGWVWLLYRRLWVAAAIYVVLEVAFFYYALPHLAPRVALACDVLARLFVGLEGNRWREARGARGATVTDVVEARDRAAAEVAFFARQAAGRTVAGGTVAGGTPA